MKLPLDLKYTKSHEWIRLEGDEITMGITDFAQDALGDVVFFDPPEVGDELNKGEPMGEVESVKAVSDVYSPISGQVLAVNESLEDQPELVNQEPFGQGWMVKIKISDTEELSELLEAAAYQTVCEEA